MSLAHLLIVDDDADALELLEGQLTQLGYAITICTDPREAVRLADTQEFDAVVTDLMMRTMDGLEVTKRINELRPDLPVILVTGHGTLDAAIGALRSGAYDFLTKPVDPALLAAAVARATKHTQLVSEVSRLRRQFEGDASAIGIIGSSGAMRKLQEVIARVAPSVASVFVHGETGTGKELIARAIHLASRRASGPFIAINCAAVPANLLESELFGHAKGAFTDARADRKGLFLQASGGTLFLDEIGEMPLDMQAKLLRALQERKVRPIGSNTEIPFDARIVSATNRDLEEEIAEKRFREDLFYRINVVRVDLPPLRERAGDVLEIAHHFLARFSELNGIETPVGLSTAAAERLMSYDWPGNVRELENCIERAVAMVRGPTISVDDLPDKVRLHRTERLVVSAEAEADIVTLDELERRYMQRVIQLVGGNKSRAAQLLGLDRRTLYRRLERYETEARARA